VLEAMTSRALLYKETNSTLISICFSLIYIGEDTKV